jgi:hypothetical protein
VTAAPAPAAPTPGPAAPAGNAPGAAAGPGAAGANPPAGQPPTPTDTTAPGDGAGPGEGQRPNDEGGGRDSARADAGADAAAATKGFGQGGVRHGTVLNALADLDGDMVGGDKYVFLLGGKRHRLRRISPLMEESARRAFHEPPEWAAVREEFGKRRIVILRAEAGWGKTTAAIRLLLGCGVERIYHLDRNVDFGSLAERLDPQAAGAADRVDPGSAFLLDRPTDIAALRGWLLQGLESSLEHTDARLVLTVLPQAGMTDADLLDYVVDLTAPPGHRELVSRYLRWRLGDRRAGYLLADDLIGALLDEHLGADTTCKLAADLASAIVDAAETADSGLPDVARIRDQLARRGAEDFEIWIEGLHEPRLRSFATALAVLNGLPHEEIAAATRSLHRRIDPVRRRFEADEDDADPDPPERRRIDPYGPTGRRRLARLRAECVSVELDTVGGPLPALVMRYKDSDYRSRVIRHAWSQYQVQDALLGWFAELVTDVSEEVRIYASVALGVIGCDSLQYLIRHVLRPWAYDDHPLRRSAVAYALSVCAADPRLRPHVHALAEEWFADTEHPMAQATAARVYGLSLSGAEPLAAIDALVRLCVVDNVTVEVAIGHSLTDLLTEDADLTAVVLRRLRAALLDHRSRPAALLTFLIVATQFGVYTDDLPISATIPEWPALLHRADTDDETREPLVALWRAALHEPLYRLEAERVLRTWAALAESDPLLREAFLRMAGALAAGDPRSTTALLRHAVAWGAQALVPLPGTALALRALLDREQRAEAGR